mmetsp:Transcript_25012/g.40189  ORF Transcript_25012/g.40189 Transcript_25012/m.40189 type:complete len:216 (+) Transcript_25012:97-744(+)|eukprot:CAMPEP_0169105538 /NCGR_PEP_ID=MMETSP1015-20121227/23849_1 /TAXON_ID=342587 /ORGANISM="Karlodinium micrum, Strain CCMP2283" /LENGTH=215 /DNA_ID=CAMNT_0009166903 /DNA_START=94 /DNA_END=741 /DNA_ORIENTATION=+
MADNPPPQMVGSGHGTSDGKDPAAEMQRQMAAAAAKQAGRTAASQAKAGVGEITAYIMENPTSVKIMCFMMGIVLIIFSILGCFGLFGADDFEPKHYLAQVYNVFFGIIICICDGKESWMKDCCCDVQSKLFANAYILANQTGRAVFYLYVASMTLLLLPDNWTKVFYCAIGGILGLLALWMLIVDWFGKYCGCKSYHEMSPTESSASIPAATTK